MKLFLLPVLLMLLGLDVATTAGSKPQPGEFEVLVSKSDPQDLDQTDLETLQKNGTSQEYLTQLLARNVPQPNTAKGELQLPPGYTNSKTRASAMFDSNSDTNEEVEEATTTTTTTAPTTTRSSVSIASVGAQRGKRDVRTNLYYCRHSNYLLRWFPVYSWGALTKICFVPWAPWQGITYARCFRNQRCKLNYGRRGFCRPSCFERRYIRAYCFNLRTGRWGWSWEIRKLPQACRCSTC